MQNINNKLKLILPTISILINVCVFDVYATDDIVVLDEVSINKIEDNNELHDTEEIEEIEELQDIDELEELQDTDELEQSENLFEVILTLDDEQTVVERSEIKSYLDVLYDRTSGMPTSEANDIVQTDDGYMWIASYSSLLRFDGREFVSITEPKGLTSVICLFKDSRGRLWIGTNNDGVALYENNEFKFVDTKGLEKSYSVRSIAEDSYGNIIIGTTMGIYQIDDNFDITFIEDGEVTDAYISKMKGYGDGKVVGITKAGSFFILQDLEVIEYIDIKDWEYDIPLSVLPINDTTFLVGVQSNYMLYMQFTENGIEYYRLNTWTLDHINALVQMEEYGDIWIASDTGAGFIDNEGNIYILGALKANNSIENIYQDYEGNYWLASSKQGVLKITINIFQELTKGIENISQVNGVELVGNHLYFVSDLGIQILDLETSELIENELTQGFANIYTRCVEKDLFGNLWFSTYSDDALVKYTPDTGEINIFNVWNGLDYTRVRSSMTTSIGETWVATGNGVYVIRNDKVIKHFGVEEGINNLEILSLSEDLSGRIYVGTDGAGLYIIEDMEVVQNISKKDGLTSEIILRTEADTHNGGVWLVTGNSISYYSASGELTNIDKFPYGNNFDLLFNGEEIIVLSSNGIYFTTRESMLSEDENLEYIHKNHLDGLDSTIVVNSFSTIVDDVLYICGNGAVTGLPLDFSSSSFTVPDINFMAVEYNNEKIYPAEDGKFYLSSDVNQMNLDILIPTYALQNFDISYSLQGYDKAPRVSSFETFVDPSYTNLPGGAYNFVLEILDTRTGELKARNEVIIIKEYTFSENPTVRLLTLVLWLFVVFIIIYTFFKIRENKVRQSEEKMINLFEEVVLAFSKVIDAKDGYTNGHSRRVAIYTREMSRALGFSDKDITMNYGVALLHDVGKITVPDVILNKPNRLTDEEFEIMKSHPDKGAEILDDIKSLPEIAIGAKYHHEKYDGTGYGYGLKGEEIPLIARIICIADAFDAMYSSRVYRKRLKLKDVLEEIEQNKGNQFDPELSDMFINLIKEGKLDDELAKLKEEEEAGRQREIEDINRAKEAIRIAEEREQALKERLLEETRQEKDND